MGATDDGGYPDRRDFLAKLALCGAALDLCLYAGSFSMATVRFSQHLVISQVPGILVLGAMTAYGVNQPWSARRRRWKQFVRGRPDWVGPVMGFLIVLLLAHFAMLAELGQGGVAIIQNGQMMLDDNGHLWPVGADQYLATAGGGVRVLVLLTMSFWYSSFVECWYPNYDPALDD